MSGSGKPPTAAEQWWMDECRHLSCAVCYRIGLDRKMEEWHHILDGGRRVGHACGLPLCHDHHQMPGGPASFERRFKFTELDLLNDTIGRVVAQVRQRGRA